MIVRVVVVVAGCLTTQAVLATRLTRFTVRGLARCRTVFAFAFAWRTSWGRSGGFSATWTAPPPMIAPPQVQAQSFAKAILTDIKRTLFQALMKLRIVVVEYPSASSGYLHRCKGFVSAQAR